MADVQTPVALSVILPVYNGGLTLAEQLDSLVGQLWDRPWEVVIVNNASTDETPSIAARYVADFPDRFRTVDAPLEHNLSYVRNVGVTAAGGDAVAFCDADDIVGAGWVAAIGEAVDDHELVGSSMEYDRLNDMAETGASRFASHGFSSMFGLACISGGGLGCQKWLWEALGGNDESWNATGEDFDFGMRAQRDYGIQPYFAEAAIYHVRLRGDSKSMFRQNRRFGRSHARLFKRHGSPQHRTPVPVALRSYAGLLANIGDLRHEARSKAWARAAGKRLGRIEGSIRYRTLFL